MNILNWLRGRSQPKESPANQSPQSTDISDGIKILLRCLRREVFGEEKSQLLSEAVKRLQDDGAVGSNALAKLVNNLLACRSGQICIALSISKELEPTPQLISAIKAVQSAPRIVYGTAGEFAPEIFGENQIGWTGFTYDRAISSAKEAIDVLLVKFDSTTKKAEESSKN